MDRNDLASRRRSTVDVPMKPEAGLAEWTSKIKALQKQVDDDEEAETRRLEEEIAASRLARMRRSTGRGTSVDLSNTDVARSLKDDESRSAAGSADSPRSAGDRREGREDTLRKLMGERKISTPPPPTSSAPISLAAFMGGRATGPRLNRHAPQQDAHDPTQFEQRTVTAPHPVFGRGGVAMPGMASRNRKRDEEDVSPKPQTETERISFRSRPETPSSNGSSSLRTPTERAEERRSVSPQKAGGSSHSDFYAVRQRTMSTPAQSASHSLSASRSPEPHSSAAKFSPRPPSYASGDYMTAKALPQTGRHTPSNIAHQSSPPRANSVSPLPHTPSRQTAPPSLKSPTLSSTPGLAKPIQPAPRKSFQGPQIPLSQNASPAFLRPPPAKDPTPSLSRLQGRGFVQNMVKASSQISSSNPSSAAGTPEKERDPPRKGSVLERWQFNNTNSPPIIAPKPVPMRKSRTVDASLASPTAAISPAPASPSSPTFRPPSVKSIKPEHTGKSLKSKTSLPSLSHAATEKALRPTSSRSEVGTISPPTSQKRGLGSSTTMISYIKPLKTGDNPATSAPPSRPSSRASRSRPVTPDVDEMGIRVRSRAKSVSGAERESGQDRHVGSPPGAANGRPLSHPTKDRARKPRKAKTAVKEAGRPQHAHSGTSAATGPTSAAFQSENTLAPPPVARTSRVRFSPEPEEIPDIPPPEHRKPSPSPSPPSSGVSRRVHFPLDTSSAPAPQEHHERSPSTPVRHTRIPSTGNRATVMEVAQALSEHEKHARRLSSDAPLSPISPPVVTPKHEELTPEEEAPPRLDVKSIVSNWGAQSNLNAPASPTTLERRKSSYEKYSAFALPPLVEERTPAGSPAGTLSKSAAAPGLPEEPVKEVESPQEISPPVPSAPEAKHPTAEDRYQHFDHHDEPLPNVNVKAILNAKPPIFSPDPDAATISVEVMIVVGSNANAVETGQNVFYDSETLAIVHRFKTKSSGLVNTKVWAWYGAKSEAGEREERKLQDLARRYNTPLVVVRQYGEPAELVHVLGGQLATRQGTRAHWSAENTAMHLVRSINGLVHIDELELGIRNLCSGYSYCLSLLGTFYVWHGIGSIPAERQAAMQYAQSLASDPSNVIEISEGDEDEMFWLIVGEGEYAKADYWRWRPSQESLAPRVWQIDTSNAAKHVVMSAIDSDVHDRVHVLDCVWEYFVIIGSDARGKRKDIRLALELAKQMSAATAASRPFNPTVHVLILPSQLPADLRLTIRGLDETLLNRGSVPDHMNLLSYNDAIDHLQKASWEKRLLRDETMLPLGLQNPR